MSAKRLEKADGTTIQAIEKAVEIIHTLESLEEATPTEVAAQTGISRSTVHVYLRTLRQYGYVVKGDSGYRTGLKFLAHGGLSRKRLPVYDDAKLEVDRLARETGELSDLGVEQDGMRVILYKAETDRSVYDNVITGDFTHMHWTALGKALLAWRSDDDIDEIIDRHGLPEATASTITDPAELEEELQRTVERGYSIGNEERRHGITSIGVPILDNETGEAVAALSVAGPHSRVHEGRIEEIVEELEHSANVIELRYKFY